MKSTSALHPEAALEAGALDLAAHQRLWHKLGAEDPFWAVLTDSGKKGNRWDAEEFFATGRDEVRELMLRLEILGLEVSRGHALDFGCGVGRLTQALAGSFLKVTGVDISAPMIERARALAAGVRDNCHFEVNGRPDLQLFPNNYFDLVFSKIVLQHNQPKVTLAYLNEFVRVARPGGLIVFQLPAHPSATWIGVLLRILPVRLVRTIRKMDMYGIPQATVLRVLENAGATAIHYEPDAACGRHWKGFQYYARKSGPPLTNRS